MEADTITGFDIPKRELTSEEADTPITFERFKEFHINAGEDFCDTCGSEIDTKVMAGFLLCKRPEWNKELLGALNNKYTEPLSFLHVYEEMLDGETGDESYEAFYTDLAAFIDLTGALKRRINQIFIQVNEYYNK